MHDVHAIDGDVTFKVVFTGYKKYLHICIASGLNLQCVGINPILL